jgi:hypothetical protein
MPEVENPQDVVTTAGATRECARLGVELSEAALKRAADRGELVSMRTADRGMRLFRIADVRAFARARLA